MGTAGGRKRSPAPAAPPPGSGSPPGGRRSCRCREPPRWQRRAVRPAPPASGDTIIPVQALSGVGTWPVSSCAISAATSNARSESRSSCVKQIWCRTCRLVLRFRPPQHSVWHVLQRQAFTRQNRSLCVPASSIVRGPCFCCPQRQKFPAKTLHCRGSFPKRMSEL